MQKQIDVYRDWLGITEAQRPLNFYDLLRLKAFEDDPQKVREVRLRRMAERQRLSVEKCRRRDPLAIGFGTYRIVGPRGGVVAGHPERYGLTLDDVEAFLTRDEE